MIPHQQIRNRVIPADPKPADPKPGKDDPEPEPDPKSVPKYTDEDLDRIFDKKICEDDGEASEGVRRGKAPDRNECSGEGRT